MKVIWNIAYKNMKSFFTNVFFMIFLTSFPLTIMALFSNAFNTSNIMNSSEQFVKVTLLTTNLDYTNNLFAGNIFVMFLLITSVMAAGLIINEKEEKTLMRMATLPISKRQLILGLILGLVIEITLLSVGIQIISHYLFGIYWGSNIGEIFIITILSVIVVSSLGIFMSAIFKNGKTAGGIMSGVVIIMTFLSGSMTNGIPIFKNSDYFTLNKWISACFKGLMLGKSLNDILINILVLILVTTLFLVTAIFLFRKEEMYE